MRRTWAAICRACGTPPLPPARAEPESWLPGEPASLHLSVSRRGAGLRSLVYGLPGRVGSIGARFEVCKSLQIRTIAINEKCPLHGPSRKVAQRSANRRKFRELPPKGKIRGSNPLGRANKINRLTKNSPHRLSFSKHIASCKQHRLSLAQSRSRGLSRGRFCGCRTPARSRRSSNIATLRPSTILQRAAA